MKKYFGETNVRFETRVVGDGRVVHVRIEGKKYVFADPKKSGYAADWAKAHKRKVPRGYNIDHVMAKSRARNRFKFVMLRAVQKDVNQQVGRIWEARTARMSKTELKQLNGILDTDVARGYRKAGPMENLKLNAVHGVPESRIRVPISDKKVIMRTISLKDYKRRNFIRVSGRALSGSLIVFSTAMVGTVLINALEDFYKSPIVARTKRHLQNGEYAAARNGFITHCVNDQTAKAVCEKLRHAISATSSVLRARIWMDFPDFAMKLYEGWEEDARRNQRESDEVARLLEPQPRPRPPDPIAYNKLSNSTYISLKIDEYPPRTVLKGQIVPINVRLLAYVDGYWVRVDNAPIKRTLNNEGTEIDKTNNEGIVSFNVIIPDKVMNNVLTLDIERQHFERKYFIRSYEYAVEQNGDFPTGRANGEDSILLSFKLTKRFVDSNGRFFSRSPLGYKNDLDSVAFKPKWTGQPTDLRLGLDSQTMDNYVVLPPSPVNGDLAFLMTSFSPGDFKFAADLRGGKFRNIFVEVGEFVVTFGAPPPTTLRATLKESKKARAEMTVGKGRK